MKPMVIEIIGNSELLLSTLMPTGGGPKVPDPVSCHLH
jgi:hypothetical protein